MSFQAIQGFQYSNPIDNSTLTILVDKEELSLQVKHQLEDGEEQTFYIPFSDKDDIEEFSNFLNEIQSLLLNNRT